MLILADDKLPLEIKSSLGSLGDFYGFITSGITYEAISGHPDIFFTKLGHSIIAAPNTPQKFISLFQERNIPFLKGEKPIGMKYPLTAPYCVVTTQNFFIHKTAITDPVLFSLTSHLVRINVPQGYTRCSLIALGEENFITSDEGIYKALRANKLNCLLADATEVILPGFPHGFLGGACGVYNNTLYFTGSLKTLRQGSEIKDFIRQAGHDFVELGKGKLFDCGSILFL